VAVLGEQLPPERVAGFILVWIALVVLTVDALRATSGALRRRSDREGGDPEQPAPLGAGGVV